MDAVVARRALSCVAIAGASGCLTREVRDLCCRHSSPAR